MANQFGHQRLFSVFLTVDLAEIIEDCQTASSATEFGSLLSLTG